LESAKTVELTNCVVLVYESHST